MAAAGLITIGVELEGVFVELACYVMSAFAIGFGTSTVKSFIETRGYKVKEGETATESKNTKNISQTYKLEYNYKNKLQDLGSVYFFSEEAKGKLSDSFLPLGLVLKGNKINQSLFMVLFLKIIKYRLMKYSQFQI